MIWPSLARHSREKVDFIVATRLTIHNSSRLNRRYYSLSRVSKETILSGNSSTVNQMQSCFSTINLIIMNPFSPRGALTTQQHLGPGKRTFTNDLSVQERT